MLAGVVMGLVVGRRWSELSTPASRLRGYAFWEVLVFLLNAVLFILVGLQLPSILEEQEHSGAELAALGVLVSATVIAVRLLWTMNAPFVIRALDRRESQLARRTTWQTRPRGRLGRAAGRGLAGRRARAPPRFPERGLLIFLTLCVIFATLVVQGLTLPLLIARVGVHDDGGGEVEELLARREATAAAIAQLERLGEEEWTRDDTIERMTALYRFRDRRLRQRAGELEGDEDDDDLDVRSHRYQKMVRQVLDAQRSRIIELRDEGAISDDVLHALERELDLEDQRLEI